MSDNTEGLARRLIRECDWNMDKARAALEHALETVRYEYCQRCLKHTRCWEGLPAYRCEHCGKGFGASDEDSIDPDDLPF